MLAVAPHLAAELPQLLSMEVWGGATFDVALRFLHEDPWERLAQLRELVPNVCLQMLLRGQNLLAYSRFPEPVVRAFVAEAAAAGIDVFRIFDALNDVEGMRAAIEATLETHAIAEGTLCYTGDLSDPRETLYTLDYYLRLAEQLVEAGVHVLAIKDMAGLLRAPAARTLVTALRREFELPVHLHTHDTAGGQLATYLAAIEAGVDAVDGAAAPLAGMTSQPSLAAIVAATATTERDTGLSLDALLAQEPYWEAVRGMYGAFETGLKAPTGRVYRHEMPGGQISNLRQQADAVGLAGRFEEVELAYERANALLGHIVKVTPSSKVVGDLALFAVSAGIDLDELERRPGSFDLPDSVIDFLRGGIGTPPAGFPQPFTELALAGRAPAPAPLAIEGELARRLDSPGEDRRAALAELLFPGPAREFAEARERVGRRLADPDAGVLPRPARGGGAGDRARPRRHAAVRAGGDRRGRRARHADRARARQRPAAPDRGARQIGRGGRRPDRARRPDRPRPGAGAGHRHRHAAGQSRRRRQRGRPDRDARGDEDGVDDHRAALRHRRPPRRRLRQTARAGRPAAGAQRRLTATAVTPAPTRAPASVAARSAIVS